MGAGVAVQGISWGRVQLRTVAAVLGVAAYLAALWFLRHSTYRADQFIDVYLQMGGSLIAFTFAANAMVRFRGTHDRISLILAFGFALAGLIEAGSSMTLYRGMLVVPTGNDISLGWLAGRTLLGTLMVAAVAVEKWTPIAREPAKDIAAATLVVGGAAYLTSVFYFMLPHAPQVHPGAGLPRAWDLLPAAIFIAAAVGYGRRLGHVNSRLDRALFVAAILNAASHVTMSQSQRPLDAASTLAHLEVVLSYVIVLGGTLLDNAQLFDQVSHWAASDSLTGLANHRRLVEVLENEIQRSRRTGRNFAVLLFDLDGLKKINDRYGHLTGSRAIKRLGAVLRDGSRSIDTPARYGGDEFALILPEAGAPEAYRAAERICERLAADGQEPRITVSVGQAVYPTQGTTIEELLGAADRALYEMKGQEKKRIHLPHVAACL